MVMKTIRLHSSGAEVLFLNEILADLDYDVSISNAFEDKTDQAVHKFQ